jgi:membrane protease YdiL (CAAX protease family)
MVVKMRVKLVGIDDNYNQDIFFGLIAGVIFVMMSSVSSISIGIPAPIYPQSALPEVVNMLSSLIVVGVLAPIFEETMFRGAVFFMSRKVTSNIPAIIITSIGFSLFHWTAYGEALAAAFVGAFFFSVVTCMMVLKTKSLIPGMIMHAIVNIYLFIQAGQLFMVGGI